MQSKSLPWCSRTKAQQLSIPELSSFTVHNFIPWFVCIWPSLTNILAAEPCLSTRDWEGSHGCVDTAHLQKWFSLHHCVCLLVCRPSPWPLKQTSRYTRRNELWCKRTEGNTCYHDVNTIDLNSVCSCNLISQSVFPENDINGHSLEKYVFRGQISLGSIDFKKSILCPQRAI